MIEIEPTYPSLQAARSFDLPTAVATLDQMVLRMRFLESALANAEADVAKLPVKRRDRLARDRIVRDLNCERMKTGDALAVYGFGAS